jgi:DNA-binding IscR family transcriptional regulator
VHGHASRRRAAHHGRVARGGAGGFRARACGRLAHHRRSRTVTLRQLHEALGEPAIFAIGNRNQTPACLVEQAVNATLNDAFADAEALLLARFETVTLADLAAEFSRRFAEHKTRRKNDAA